jgi:2-hydroxychromene-2-carboxylate isomerase
MAKIQYFFGINSVFAYLAGGRLEEIAARRGADIIYRPIDLGGLFPRTGGQPLAERHPARQAYRLQDLRRQARKMKLDLNERPAFWPANPAPASYAIIAAQSAGGGDVGMLVRSLLRAQWAEDRDVASDEVIRDCLAKNDFAPDLADRGMLSAAEAYGRNLEDAVSAGVFGSPFYVVGEEMFWGQDRLDDLSEHLAGRL